MACPCSQVILKPVASSPSSDRKAAPILLHTVQWVFLQEVLDSHSMVQHRFEVPFGVWPRMIILQPCGCAL